MLDASLNFFNRHAVGFFHLTTELTDDVLKFLWDRRAAVHDQVSIRKATMNLFDQRHLQHFTRRLVLELVSTVAGADGDGQCIASSLGDEAFSFFRISQVR